MTICLATDHDLSTLKLVQIVHRHGDRAPNYWKKNDPFHNLNDWPNGFGELTSKGKTRMYRLGQYYRKEYDSFLGPEINVHKLYVRSSSSHRCIESVSAMLAGFDPPTQKDWQWDADNNLGHLWQPFPIETFIPKSRDIVLEGYTNCPIADQETNRIYNSTPIKDFEKQNIQLYHTLTQIAGEPIDNIYKAVDLFDTLQIETENGKVWPAFKTLENQTNYVNQLSMSGVMGYRYDWDSPILQRLRAGGLVRELNLNFEKGVNKSNEFKLYIYSTHGENIGAIMAALNIFNWNNPPFGCALLFELHESNGNNFVRVYIQNSTDINTGVIYPMTLTNCNNQYDCPIKQYFNSTTQLLYDPGAFDTECAIPNSHSYKQVYTIVIILSKASNRWPNHDISTLKLLQIVHRHGDRSPTSFSQNDPFNDVKYWIEGIGELTTKGKYRLYKFGQFIRQEYGDYFGDQYSPREVYARSALSDRCIESVSNFLAGAYPPMTKQWQWNNGSDAKLGQSWQPFPIETFMPHIDDLVLHTIKSCPLAERESKRVMNNTIIQEFVANNRQLYDLVGNITNTTIDNIVTAGGIHGTLDIEMDHNYYWDHYWTHEEEQKIVQQLYLSHLMKYRYEFDSHVLKRLRAGGLIKELNNNFENALNNTNNKKLYVYGTHDITMNAYMQAMDIFNDQLPPFGSALIFELHRHNYSTDPLKGYFVKIFYQNETTIGKEMPHQLQWTNCMGVTDCPLDKYFDTTKPFLYEDFDKECNQL
ncbi:uncharacterized protein LOC128966494 [Oppia nitens]|uniref:uncharacterized protein LOC128966494 n=1 Tax=Oppia nitens TaxID=1686743 RepID=UPI0023DB062C|nr:uncharacterized protein LOC128966494 [Oppia nitens]